jgi:hypothetical protein
MLLYDKKALRGCALGAGVDGCQSNRASARECAKAHSFFVAPVLSKFYKKALDFRKEFW